MKLLDKTLWARPRVFPPPALQRDEEVRKETRDFWESKSF
jgi:hypothetical protein